MAATEQRNIEKQRKTKEVIHFRRQRPTLNRDRSYQPPAIFNQLLSRGKFTEQFKRFLFHKNEPARLSVFAQTFAITGKNGPFPSFRDFYLRKNKQTFCYQWLTTYCLTLIQSLRTTRK